MAKTPLILYEEDSQPRIEKPVYAKQQRIEDAKEAAKMPALMAQRGTLLRSIDTLTQKAANLGHECARLAGVKKCLAAGDLVPMSMPAAVRVNVIRRQASQVQHVRMTSDMVKSEIDRLVGQEAAVRADVDRLEARVETLKIAIRRLR